MLWWSQSTEGSSLNIVLEASAKGIKYENGINAIIYGVQHRSRAVLGDKRHLGALRYPRDILMLVRYVTGWVCVSLKRDTQYCFGSFRYRRK